jgi:hypothetical protein
MRIKVNRGLALPTSEYFAEPQVKSGIVLHHTVCDDADTTVRLWRTDQTADGKPRHVATAYVIDWDGTVFELFDPAHWAFSLGLPWPSRQRVAFEKRFIGIEITSAGGLTEHEGRLYAYGLIAPEFERLPAAAFECTAPYRGFRWFDRYRPEQLQALGGLVDDLCDRFAIERVYPEQPFLYYGEKLESFRGVIGHAMVREDKSDPTPDPELWQTLETMAGLQPVAVTARLSSEDTEAPRTRLDTQALFHRNVRRINRLNTGAGSLVKNLLMELERRRTFVELNTPQTGSHTIDYQLLEGDRAKLERIAKALGFERVTETELEVADA